MNSKNKKVMGILLLAVIMAIAASVALYFYLTPQKTTVYVFNDDYSAGTTLTEDMLTPVQVDSSIVVAGASSDTSSVFITGSTINSVLNTGDTLKTDVSDGMPLMSSLLSVTGGSDVEQSMDPTMVAVTVSISSITGVTSDLDSGDKVNIYATGGDSSGTTLILQGVKILSVQKDSDGGLESATLEVSTNDSLTLIYAANYCSLYFGLIDTSGYEYSDGTPSYAPSSSE